jgi:hypothetical protein
MANASMSMRRLPIFVRSLLDGLNLLPERKFYGD